MKRNKKGAIELSFGMIFSIILIIAFLVFAFYVIKKVVEIGDDAKVGIFLDDLQKDINKMWKSSHGSEELEYSLPTKIQYVCFEDFSVDGKGSNFALYEELKMSRVNNENLIFYPYNSSTIHSKEIKNIDIDETTGKDNPLCFANEKGKVRIVLKKDYNNPLVILTK